MIRHLRRLCFQLLLILSPVALTAAAAPPANPRLTGSLFIQVWRAGDYQVPEAAQCRGSKGSAKGI